MSKTGPKSTPLQDRLGMTTEYKIISMIEKADALTNLIEQMLMAHRIGDEKTFMKAHDKAAKIGFELVNQLDS